MKTALKFVVLILSLGLVAAAAFYLGHQWTLAQVVRERVATDAVQRVVFLVKFRDSLSEQPRLVLEDELARMTSALDLALHERSPLFLDREAVSYARDNALVYFHTFPPAFRLADGSRKLIDAFAATSQTRQLAESGVLKSHHQRSVAADARLERLLKQFDASKLDLKQAHRDTL